MTDADALRDYHGEITGGHLSGYVYGNRRIEAALRFVLEWTPPGAMRILDAGCGIGESTDTLKRHHPRADVRGIDTHDDLLEIATRLFGDGGARFDRIDLVHAAGLDNEFDVIVLMDVYEHIPRGLRPALHATLSRLLAPGGRILLTVPSLAHQQFLREERPSGLQPIDEDVSRGDLEDLAVAVSGSVAHTADVTVWRPGDYLHAVIARGPAIRIPSRPMRTTQRAREARVATRLGVRISRNGARLPCRGGLKVCIAQPNCDVYSERLIRDQLERLPADVTMICDGWLPRRQWNGERVLPLPLAAVRRAAAAWLPSLAPRISTFGLSQYLREHRIDVVLAQYGVTGAAVADACHTAGVPLVVQFHGFDAHHRPTLEEHREAYRRLFARVSALVAVSRKMTAQLIALGAAPDKVIYNPPGVDCARFSGADPAASPPTFISVGRFVHKKAPHFTLQAFQQVRAEHRDARLIMFGDGYLLESCSELARSLGLADAVEFRGATRHHEVRAALREARAFVLHSVEAADGDSEGTPVALLEASASGLPVVATRHAGITDVVIDGETGSLVDEGDVAMMAARMIELARNPDLAARQGARGRAHIAAHYSIEKNIAALSSVLTSAAAGLSTENTP